jgi:hypothetical protein
MRRQSLALAVLIGLSLISGCINQSFADSENRVSDYLGNGSPFGIAFGTEDHFEQYGEGSIQLIRDAGATDFGIHVFWGTIEPENDSYDWSIIDQYVDQIQPGDNAHIMVFTDGWCTTGEVEKGQYIFSEVTTTKGSPLLNANCEQEYRDFIHDLAVRANGKIKYWQRDIEPATPEHWPAERKEEYVELQKIFYEEVKSVIPDAVIGGLGLAGGDIPAKAQEFIDYFFQHARDDFDYLDIHLYQDKYMIADRIRRITDLMHNYGYEKPLIIKECGGPILSEYSDAFDEAIQQLEGTGFQDFSRSVLEWINVYDNFDALNPKVQIFLKLASDKQNAKRDRIECRDMIQRYLMLFNEGAQKIFWWNLMAPHHPKYGPQPIFGKLKLLNENYEKLPAYFCYQRMTGKLEGVSSVERIALSDTSLYFYKISKAGAANPMYVVWHHDEGVDSYDDDTTPSVSAIIPLELSGIVTITDVFGSEEAESTAGGTLLLDIANTPLFIEGIEEASTVPAETPGTNSYHYATRLWLGGYMPSDSYLDFVAEHYEFVIVPESHPDLMQALLDRNPDIRAILYTNPVFTQPSKEYPEEHYAHSSQSTNYNGRVINERFGTYLMNISAEVWRDEVAASAERAVEDYGYFGVMADDCGPDISHRVDFVPDDYDASVWRADIRRMLSAMNDRLDCLLVFNGIYNRPEYSGRDLLEVTDGGVREGFVFHLASGQMMAEEYWNILLGYIIEDTQADYHIASAKFTKKDGTTVSADERMFAFTSYLLVKNDRVIYSPEDWGLVSGVDRTLVQYYPEMDIDLGEPLQTASRLDGYFNLDSRLYSREFEKGIVFVNPAMKPVTYELGQNCLLVVPKGGGVVNDDGSYGAGTAMLSYQSVDQVTIPAQSGVIILHTPDAK